MQMDKTDFSFWTEFINLPILSINQYNTKGQGKFWLFFLSTNNFFTNFSFLIGFKKIILSLAEEGGV